MADQEVAAADVEMNEAPAQQEPVAQDFGEDISRDGKGGLFKKILVEGEGEDKPNHGDKVAVHYTGRLMDGTVFDSSVERAELFEFKLGQGQVIKGWDKGVATMRKGERCLLTCKPDYAYGDEGSPPKIPPNATLQFEVELIHWKEGEDINKDGGVVKIIVRPGEGYERASDGTYCTVLLRGTCEGREFEEDHTVCFDYGEGCESGIVQGVEDAIKCMKRGEVARVKLTPEYAFGKEGNKELGVPPNANVEYTVTLKNFEKAKESHEYESVELRKIDSMHLKEKGSSYFKAGKYKLAMKLYERAEKLVDDSGVHKDEDKEFVKDIQLLLKLNKAAVCLKFQEPHKALNECSEVLRMDNKNVKAIYRKALAHIQLQEYTDAIEDFKRVLELEPSNKAAQGQINQCKKHLKTQHNKEKRIYAGMLASLSDDKPTNKTTPEEIKTEQSGNEDSTKDDVTPIVTEA